MTAMNVISLVLLAISINACTDSAAGSATGTAAAIDAQMGDTTALWRTQADAAPPDDTWAWNADVGQWQNPDSASGTAGDALADADSPDATAAPEVSDVPGSQDVVADAAQAEVDSADSLGGDAAAGFGQPGGPCLKHSDCTGGFCAEMGSANAYCTFGGCQTSADCEVVQSPNVPVCCVTYQGKHYCLKQYGASQCGAQDQTPGQSCVQGGQSDCKTAVGDACFAQGDQAQCVKACKALNDPTCPKGTTCNLTASGNFCLPFTPDVPAGASCADKPIGGCGPYAFCIGANKADPYAYCATLCGASTPCDSGTACWMFSSDQGICQKVGPLAEGANCANDRFACSAGLMCVGWGGADAFCSPMCSSDANCSNLKGVLAAGAFCAKGQGAAVGACYPSGSAANGDNCSTNPLVCTKGSYCIGGYDVYNPNAYCQQGCDVSAPSACPAGSKCTAYNSSYAGCALDGPLQPGQSCADKPLGCQADSLCVGAKGKEICALLCSQTSPSCPSGTWCAIGAKSETGVCLPSGTVQPGGSCENSPYACSSGALCQSWGNGAGATCISPCAADGSCGNGLDCKDFGQAGSYCEPVGSGGQGTPCVKDPGVCGKGSYCIEQGTPFAICSSQCSTDADCGPSGGQPGGLWCAQGKWGGYCLPNGGGQIYDLCYGKPFACGKGLICLGDSANNPGAFCAKECTGFASSCGASAKCQYVGGGQAWCVPTGSLPPGSPCLTQPLSCDASSLCIKGSPQPLCLQTCGVGMPACGNGTICQAFPGFAIELCVPPDFLPFGAISTPF